MFLGYATTHPGFFPILVIADPIAQSHPKSQPVKLMNQNKKSPKIFSDYL